MRPLEPTAEQFREQMQILADYFQPLPITRALELLQQDRLPINAVCVTFDDGYTNNLNVAAPILSALNIPATIFVATQYADGNNMWNDRVLDVVGNQHLDVFNCECIGLGTQKVTTQDSRIVLGNKVLDSLKYLELSERFSKVDTFVEKNSTHASSARMMTPVQVRELSDAGFEIGAHTHSHPILSTLPVEQQREEILRSKLLLEEWTGKDVIGFAYPNGKANRDYTLDSYNIVKELGFDYAVSTNWGISGRTADVFQLNRFTPWARDPIKFHAQLLRNLSKQQTDNDLQGARASAF